MRSPARGAAVALLGLLVLAAGRPAATAGEEPGTLPTLKELLRRSQWVLGALFVDQGTLPRAGGWREHHFMGQVMAIQHSPPDTAVRYVPWFVLEPPDSAAPGPSSPRDSIRWNEGDRKILFLLPDLSDGLRVGTAYGRAGVFDYTDTVVSGAVAADTTTRRPVALRMGIIAFTDTVIRLDRQLRAEADSARTADNLRAAARKPAPAAPKKAAKRPRRGH